MTNLWQKSDSIAKLNRAMLIITIISLSTLILGIILLISGYFSIHTELKYTDYSIFSNPYFSAGQARQEITYNLTLFVFAGIFLVIPSILFIPNLVIKIILIVKLSEFSTYNSKAQTSWILVLISIFILQHILAIVSYFNIKNMLNESEIHPINQAN
ncbi:hypothetical protein [Mycoplasmopsis gallopavonis]|uniref:Uncharacterized protein n=1 Tax=Mycoplasmopsis gallopavonis TaxID=76629 RepID=A0A449AYR4_9BACT|nr:hypothetical protein [Mycoplasmopsis gallopavonis]RIV16487.1 hypothetical protein D1113_02175 [Mycoplasmopsis gallopavonis]VEU72678.1 Uncharacterised protein [Mycoplasmopsis gallopavonis]